jgi:predicted  nucleic acid-binding Zn-ribbon protein
MKENNLENKLKYLYALQQVDLKIQEIHDLKGDLPSIVANLQQQANEIKAKLKELNDVVKNAKIERDNDDVEIIELAEKVEKYKSQQLQVKSNKQYDALTKEIEAAETKSAKMQKDMEILEGKIQVAKTDIETITGQQAELNLELDGRQKELREVNKEHEKEELKLQHEREKLLVRVDKGDFERYERIRKAKGGKAVVAIKRDACGGCFNRVPPQKILELRQNSKFFTCEHCGRILVSDQIVEMSVLS